MAYVSDRRLYRTVDDEVVEEGHPDAAFLLVNEGGTLSEEDVRKYGIEARQPEPVSPLENERKALAAAEARGAFAEAESRRLAVARMEAEERVQAAQAEQRSRRRAGVAPAAADAGDAGAKAVAGPPENKAQAEPAPKAADKK
jgi:hypothetical protein